MMSMNFLHGDKPKQGQGLNLEYDNYVHRGIGYDMNVTYLLI